jgi:hypothetical protein
MANFFTTSDNKAIENQNTFDMGGGDFEPIPNNTQLKAIIEEAKWDDYQGDEYISLKWSVIDGEFKGRKVFQKIRVLDADTKKADKAKTMLAAIDSNAGGALMKAGVMPDDMALSINLMNKPMAIIVAIWEMDNNGDKRTGNWIKAVSPLNTPAPVKKETEKLAPMDNSFDADVGF